MKPTPRFDSWWNSYRSGAVTADDFKEAVRGMERELSEEREAVEVAVAAIDLSDPVIDKLTAENAKLKRLMRRAIPTIDSRETDYADEFKAACR